MTLRSLRRLSPDQDSRRYAHANAVRQAYDVPGFPRLRYWNYQPCPRHGQLTPLCPDCGAEFRRHQRVGATWLWLAKRGLLSDPTGSGKTITVAGTLAMALEAGEAGQPTMATLGGDSPRRVVIVAGAVLQWRDELRRLIPGAQVTAATGTLRQRTAKYLDPWDILVVSPETLRMRAVRHGGQAVRHGDLELLREFDIGTLVYDDVDAMRNHLNKSAYAVNSLAETADRVIGVHATPLQKRVEELWHFTVPIGGLGVFGPLALFRHNFVATTSDFYETRDQFGQVVVRERQRDSGVRNGARLRSLVAPLVLRRTPAQIDDMEMPALQPSIHWLEPGPEQRQRYAELRRGVLRRIREDGEQVTHAQAMAQFMHGWQICSGLATLDGVPSAFEDGANVPHERWAQQAGVKLGWVVDRLDGDMSEDKVVCFVNFKPNVVMLSRRLTALGIDHVVMWGNEGSKTERHERQRRFLYDPACRVLIGTTTIERSFNLQSARHLIATDTLINPARMTQLAGRIRRDGSPHHVVYFHQLLLRGTQEAAYPAILQREQAVADYVWGEQSDLFEPLSPLDLLRLISGDPNLVAQAS